MEQIKHPWAPQFTIRWILLVTGLLALVSLVVSLALRGSAWATGVSLVFVALAVAFAVYAGLFGVAYVVASLAGRGPSTQASWTGGDSPARSNQGKSPPASGPTAVALLLAFGGWGLPLLATSLASAPVWAASGQSITYPLAGPNVVNNTGLTLTIDTSWVDSFGYRPVRVELKSTSGPVQADRVLQFEFRAGSWYYGYGGASNTVTQTLELPEGQSSAKFVIAVPQRSEWWHCEWDVYEDGRRIELLSSGGASGISGGSSADFGINSPPRMLSLDPEGTLSGNLSAAFGQSGSIIYVAAGNSPSATSAPHVASLGDLPTRWIDYTQVDIVMTSYPQLQALVQQHAPQWKAIRRWLQAGGTLVVHGVGEKWENLDALGELIQVDKFPELAPRSGIVGIEPPYVRGWRLPSTAMRHVDLNSYRQNTGVPYYNTAEVAVPPDSLDQVANEAAAAISQPFVQRPFGCGVVAAIRSDDKFQGSQFNWSWMYGDIGPDRWQWHQRYGMSPQSRNSDFWNFLIPGVGAAPVTAFQVLITLFVIIIGPLNYFLLRRIGKLNLMILTAPACALLITGALLTYAAVADGFHTQLRSRSLTYLNQPAGEATCWGRLSFYAGLAPRDGLTFSEDSAVFQMIYEPDLPQQTLNWRRTEPSNSNSPLVQHLSEGWLKSRTPTQFITTRVCDAKRQMQFAAASSAGLKATNKLDTSIKSLIVVDESGKCFSGTSIDDGATVELKPEKTQSAAAISYFIPLQSASEPQAPAIDHSSGGGFGISKRRYFFSHQAGNVSQSDSVLERSLRDLRNQLMADKLPPRSYVAVVDEAPDLETGLEGATKSEGAFHVIVGRW